MSIFPEPGPTPQDYANTDLLYGRLNALEHCIEQLWTFRLVEEGATPDQAIALGASIARRAENIGVGDPTAEVGPDRIYAISQNMISGIERLFDSVAADLRDRQTWPSEAGGSSNGSDGNV